jgi:hypothetical protein
MNIKFLRNSDDIGEIPLSHIPHPAAQEYNICIILRLRAVVAAN